MIALALTATVGAVLIPSAGVAASPIQPRVVNGIEGPSPDFDFLVALGDRAYYDATGVFEGYCGGSLVSATLVVTAAHCVADYRAVDLVISTADAEGRVVGVGARVRHVATVTMHPKYDANSDAPEYDVAVLKLKSALNGVPTIRVATAEEAVTLTAPRAPVRVAGWGSISKGTDRVYPDIYQIGSLIVFPEASCGGGKPFTIDGITFYGYGPGDVNPRVMLCAEGVTGGKIVDSCVGDSGGPLIGGTSTDRRLVGIVSWGLNRCATTSGAGVYSRVSAFTAFLESAGVPFDPPPDAKPGRPTIIRVASTNTSLTVTVTPATVGAAPDRFEVAAVDASGQVSGCAVTVTPGDAGRCAIGGLVTGADYTVTATAFAGSRASTPSEAVIAQPLALPSTPRITGVEVLRGGIAGFTVANLRGNGSPLTRLTVRCFARGELTRRAPIDEDGLAIVEGLSRGSRYRCEAAVANANGRAVSAPVTLVAK